MVKRVLMIAYHYPPIGMSSGVQRTLKFSQYLPQYGWEPLVLTVCPSAYPLTSDDQLSDIPSSLILRHAPVLDTARHLAIRGHYPNLLALPDRWCSWLVTGTVLGLAMVRKYRPAAIWSTYPITTAHLLGWALSRLSGLPWVADFRDSMVDDIYPPDPLKRRVHDWIERQTIQNCADACFTAPGTLAMYSQRYPQISTDALHLIANGYDEQNFLNVEANLTVAPNHKDRPLMLIHSGTLYPVERDPSAFFKAVATLKERSILSSKDVRIVLRATGSDLHYKQEIHQYGIQDIVFVEPPLGYKDALREMIEADGLLIFQASNCNHQIPAKLYEYLRVGKPIIGFTDFLGDTADLLREMGISTITPIDDTASIANDLLGFIKSIKSKTAYRSDPQIVTRYSREQGAALLASVLNKAAFAHGSL